MPILGQTGLKGLSADDRSQSDVQALNVIQGATPAVDPQDFIVNTPKVLDKNAYVQDIKDRNALMATSYRNALAHYQNTYHVGTGSINASVKQNIKDVALKTSPYYKKYFGTDYISFNDEDWKKIAAEYQAYSDTYGVDKANQWLNQQIKNEVGTNQPWYEQMYNGFLGMGASAAGAAVSLAGNIKGVYDYVFGDYEDNPHLSGWNNFINSVMDNETTRYGDDIVKYGALFGESMNKAKELGLSNLEIVETEDQANGLISSATPWQALQSGGFTLASMFTGAAEAKVAGWLFGGLKAGAVKAIPTLYKGITTAEQLGKMKTALIAIRTAENATNKYIIPGLVGTQEGLMEGLQTKLDMIDQGKQMAYDAQAQAVAEEVNNRLADYTQVMTDASLPDGTKKGVVKLRDKDGNLLDIQDIYQQVWDEYAPKYNEVLQQVEHDATIAGINNFYVNSVINGFINSTLKAGLQAPKVQKSLQNSRWFGWAQPSTEFNIAGTGASTTVTPKFGFGKKAWQLIKEPLGEFGEEYMQSVSDATMKGGAVNNIHEFIENKYGDGDAQVGDYMSGNLAAAWTAFTGSLTDQETIKSGIMGALSSVIGTPSLGRRTTAVDAQGNVIRDEQGNAVQTYFGRGLNAQGQVESNWERLQRITPWRSGLMSSYNESRREKQANMRTAEALQEWLRDPNNKGKFDGLAGTFSWANSLGQAGRTNDEFSYRNSTLGKTINDVFMLEKLQGTEYYDAYMNQVVEMANLEEGTQEAQQLVEALKQNTNIETEGLSDSEILQQAKKNANTILSTIDRVQQESERVDKLLGQVDEDTKQSLVFGQLQMEDWQNRSKQLRDEIGSVNIENSRSHSQQLTQEQQAILAEYGSFQAAQTAALKAEEAKANLQSDIDNLKGRKNLTDREKQLLKEKKVRLKTVNKELKKLDALKTIESTDQATLNEQEIMALDPITRATMFMRGNQRLYSTIHGDNNKRQQLTDEIFDLKQQRSTLTNEQGRPKKHKFKQVQKIDQQIAEKEKQLGEIVTETRNHYTEEQQAVLDNLIARGNQQQEDFFDKVIDLGRMEASMQNFLAQYNAILSDPESYVNYVQRAKQAAADALTGKKFESLNRMTDYRAFVTEMDKLLNTGTERQRQQIIRAFNKSDNENYKRYKESRELTEKLFNKVATSDRFANMDANDVDMLAHTITYLNDQGIDLNDNNAVVAALIETDENGNKFEQYVESLNEESPQELKTVFTSIGEALQNFNDVMQGVAMDEAEQGRNAREVIPDVTISNDISQPVENPDPTPTEAPNPSGLPGIFAQAGTTPESGFTQEEQQGQGLQVEEQLPVPVGTEIIIDLTDKAVQQPIVEAPSTTATPGNPIVAAYNENSNETVAKNAELAIRVIDNSSDTYSSEAKQKAQEVIANLSSNIYEDTDEFTSALTAQANKLDTDGEEQAAALIRNAVSKVNATKPTVTQQEGTKPVNIFDKRRQEAQQQNRAMAPMMPNAGPTSATMVTIDIAYIRDKYPNSSLITYYDNHGIENYLQNHSLVGKEILFATDAGLTELVKQSMGDKYAEKTSGAIVAVVEDTDGTLEIDGKKYQPIGIMPSTNFPYSSGSANMAPIRALAKFNETALIKNTDGTNITTKPLGKSGGVKASPVDTNYQGPNNSIFTIQDNDMTAAERTQIASLSRTERRKSPIYQRMKRQFLSKLGIKEIGGRKQLVYNQDNLKGGSNSVFLFTPSINETKGKDTDETIDAAFERNDIQGAINFNSRTKRAAKEIDKFIQSLPSTDDLTFELDNGEIVPTGETVGTLNSLANSLERSVGNFIDIPTKQGWYYKVVPTMDVAGNERVFEIQLANQDETIAPISLAKVYKGMNSETAQFDILKNLIVGDSGAVRMLNAKDSFAKWQTPYNDVANMTGKAADNISDLYDDGIWTARATSFNYRIQGVAMDSPFKNDGTPRYPQTVVSNPTNAQPVTPVTQPTVVVDQTVTPTGIIVESESGAVIEGPEEVKNDKLERAKEKVNQIVEDSKAFKLSDDEKYYINTKTGKRYARVTSMIAADENSSGRFDPNSPWVTPSTNIGTGVDEFVRDFFLGKLDNLTKEQLAGQYPNATAEDLNTFKEQLDAFRNKLAAQGITIVSRDIVANGTLEIADTEGKVHTIDVAGTIDLLGYDGNGNFYIYDMKTMHNASEANKQKNKAKWERQTSMYKQFLENTYGIKIKSLQIIPISVNYPTPKGFGNGTTEYTVKNLEEATNYSNPNRTQLLANGKEFKEAKPELGDLFNLDYAESKIVWDKLTDAERDLAQSIEEEIQTGGEQVVTEGTPTNPVEAQVQEPIVPATDSILGVPFEGSSIDALFGNDSIYMGGGLNFNERLTPIPTELQWSNLPSDKKEALEAIGFDETSWSQLEDQEMQHKLDCIG